MAVEGLFILVPHYLVCVASFLWRYCKPVEPKAGTVVLGVLGVPLLGVLSLLVLDPSQHGGGGTHWGWYFILSLMSLGILPFITFGLATMTGQTAGFILRTITAGVSQEVTRQLDGSR